MTFLEKAEQMERDALEQRKRQLESWERSDTDGFLSQWSHGLHDALYQTQAEICRNGGKAQFRVLMDLDGNEVPSKLIDTKYGIAYALLDEHNKFTGKFVNPCISEKALAKKGFKIGEVWKPAWAKLTGRGRGLSGTCWVQTYVRRHPVPGVTEED